MTDMCENFNCPNRYDNSSSIACVMNQDEIKVTDNIVGNSYTKDKWNTTA